jgi:CBS domain-containing protein
LEKLPTIVEDIMSSPVITVEAETNVRDATILMSEKGIGSVIVVERGKPVGIVTGRDLLKRVLAPCKDPCEVRVKEVMTTPLITIQRDATILEAIRKMREMNIRRLVVMEDDNLVGIVSSRDLLRAISFAALTSFTTLLRRR